MYADAEVDLALARELIIACAKGGLDLSGAAHGFDGAGELGRDSVTGRIEDAATMQLHQLFKHLLVGAKCLQRPLFVLCHQTAIRCDVGGKDRRQFAFEAIGRGAAFGHSIPHYQFRPWIKSRMGSSATAVFPGTGMEQQTCLAHPVLRSGCVRWLHAEAIWPRSKYGIWNITGCNVISWSGKRG